MRKKISLQLMYLLIGGAVIMLVWSFVIPPVAGQIQSNDYSFVVMGCNRVENDDTVNNPSTANVYQLNRAFSEIAAMKPVPNFLFFTGDMIVGYEKDTLRLASELRNWKELFQKSPLAKTGIKLVVMPGNHESDLKINGKKTPAAICERIFVRELKDYIPSSNGPHTTPLKPETDSLITDQSQLTYSFDFKGDHFIVVNTDPVGIDSRVAWHWIKHDLEKAQQKKAQHIFAFGHKPAYTSHFKKGPEGIDAYPANRDSFWTNMERFHAEAFFSAHNHLWDSIQPHKNNTWQIIAGNAGSKLEKQWNKPPYAYFGYTVVNVSKDDVRVVSYGRDIDTEDYNKPMPNNPTTIRANFSIKVKK